LSASTGDKLLRANFYSNPKLAMSMMRMMIGSGSAKYISGFFNTEIPDIRAVKDMPPGGDKARNIRLIQLYWSILFTAGFEADEKQLFGIRLKQRDISTFNPGFPVKLREAIYGKTSLPPAPSSLAALAAEWTALAAFIRKNPNDKALKSRDGNDLIDADMTAALRFLSPVTGTGPAVLRPLLPFHGTADSDIISDIISQLEQGLTVIINLATPAKT
jgi:hypothetical protein